MTLLQRLANRDLAVPACVEHLERVFPAGQAAGEAGKLADQLYRLDASRVHAPLPHFGASQALALVERAGTQRRASDFVRPLASAQQVLELRRQAQALRETGHLSAGEAQAYLRWLGLADRAQRDVNFNTSIQEGTLMRPLWHLSCWGVLVGTLAAVAWAVLAASTLPGWAVASAVVVGLGVLPLTQVGLYAAWQYTPWGYSGT